MNAQVATMNPLSHSSSLFFIVSLFLSLSSVICDGLVIKDGLKRFRELQLPNNVVGPESLAFDCHGRGPYVGVADGRILKWKGARKGWTEFAFNSPKWEKKLCDGSTNYTIEATCGRPLGLKFDPKTCNLFIADAYYGILVVGQHGGVAKQLAISADDGVPFKFLNGLDVDSQTGAVYFSESSSKYQLRDAAKITAADNSGRLLRYDPGTKSVQVLLKGLAFPNGVALSKDGSFLLLAEYFTYKIYKFWLKGSKANTAELLLLLQRPPDNIKRNKEGDFWVGLIGLNKTSIASLPYWSKDPFGVKLDQMGKLGVVLDGRNRTELEAVSEVEEHDGRLWIGSASKPYAAVLYLTVQMKPWHHAHGF